jgi:hypothetical protein
MGAEKAQVVVCTYTPSNITQSIFLYIKNPFPFDSTGSMDGEHGMMCGGGERC